MQINVVNCPRRIRKKVKSAVEYYFINLVQSKRIRNNCTITINFTSSKKDLVAYADVEEYNTKGKPRGFIITLPRQDEKDVLITIAHEMIHVKQLIFEEINDRLSVWKGKFFDREKVNYFDLPWEKEAYQKEEVLYNNFMDRN